LSVSLPKIRQTLQKRFGKDTVLVDKQLQALAHMPYGISCQSNMVNLVIGRPGFPAGRLTEVVGQEASSKSTLGYHALAECQRIGGIGILIETEEAFETTRLKKLRINVDDLIICQPHHMEEAFGMMEMNVLEIRKVHAGPLLICWDSVASTPVLAETETEYDDDTMAAAARFLAKAMRKFIRTIAENKVVLIFMNQLKSTLDPYSGEKYVSYGGKAIKFHSSVRLWVKTRKMDLEMEGKEPIGQWIQVQNIKNKIATPFKTTKFFLNFLRGLDQVRDCWDFGIATNQYKELGKGRISYAGKVITKPKYREHMKARYGSMSACRDQLLLEAIKTGQIKPYGVITEVEVNGNRRRKKKEKPS
jgi:recombination protein RecA